MSLFTVLQELPLIIILEVPKSRAVKVYYMLHLIIWAYLPNYEVKSLRQYSVNVGKSAPLKQTWKQPLALNIKFYYTIHINVNVGFHKVEHIGAVGEIYAGWRAGRLVLHIDLIFKCFIIKVLCW